MCNRTQNDVIWGLIALFSTNQIAANTNDFKMKVIKSKTLVVLPVYVIWQIGIYNLYMLSSGLSWLQMLH